MQYALLIYERPPISPAANTRPRRLLISAPGTPSTRPSSKQVFKRRNPLDGPETGTTVRQRDSKRLIQDGPYANSKEQLGGFMLLECPSLDAALEWAARCPAAAYGAVEMRPVAPEFQRRFTGEDQTDELAHRAVEAVARQSYGRLVALLSARTRDLAAAEDALADALLSALTTWPRDGIPKNPQAG